MSKFDQGMQDMLNVMHAVDPQAGDYWHEMFCGIMVIIAVTKNYVAVCETKVPAGPDHWSFDLSKIKVYTRDEFNQKVRYNSESLKDKMWCDVMPLRMGEDAKEATTAALDAIRQYESIVNPSWHQALYRRKREQIRTAIKARLTRWAEAL